MTWTTFGRRKLQPNLDVVTKCLPHTNLLESNDLLTCWLAPQLKRLTRVWKPEPGGLLNDAQLQIRPDRALRADGARRRQNRTQPPHEHDCNQDLR